VRGGFKGPRNNLIRIAGRIDSVMKGGDEAYQSPEMSIPSRIQRQAHMESDDWNYTIRPRKDVC